MFRSVCLSLLLLSQGCDLFGGKRGHGDRAEHKRGEGKTEATDGLGAPVEKTDGRLRVTEGPADFTAEKTVSAPETVVFIVMDTVRADHLSLCGYDRPTSPFLQKLVADKHAAVTCKAYAPATWTTPSHASYFTGAPATEHNLLNKGHGLPREFETLAETYAFAGWQTAMISANPTLGRATGTWQGFQYAIAAEGLYKAWRGQDLVHQVGKALDQADPTKKLFLFVNVFDAHDPYPAVPENVPWLPKRERLDILPTRPEAPQQIKDFVKGSIDDAARADIVAKMIDGYDFGVSKADTTVQKVLGLIEDKGYFNRPYRVIITSDHGEHLGEHNMIRHDGPPWDAVANVPVIFIDSTVTTPPVFPDPMSSLSVYSLLKDGVMPGTPLPVASAAIRYDEEPDPSNAWFKDSVAVWNADHTKQIWIEGKVSQFNLATDPHELAPQDLAAGSPALDAGVEAMKKSKQIALAQAKDPEVMKMLEAVGYVN